MTPRAAIEAGADYLVIGQANHRPQRSRRETILGELAQF